MAFFVGIWLGRVWRASKRGEVGLVEPEEPEKGPVRAETEVRAAEEEVNEFLALPEPILLDIMALLDPEDICQVSQVNRKLNRIANDSYALFSLML